MSRAAYLASLERARLAEAQRRGEARLERLEVARGVDETVALDTARGAAFDTPAPRPGERGAPYRRLPGLEWLARKGRLSMAQKSLGEQYGAVWRAARAEPSISSSLAFEPGGGQAAPTPMPAVLAKAEARAQARARLDALRRQLGRQQDLVFACDRICGEELTPREAAANDREAGRLEAVLTVALDLLGVSERER